MSPTPPARAACPLPLSATNRPPPRCFPRLLGGAAPWGDRTAAALSAAGIDFDVKCSYLEVYRERIKDLLNPVKDNLPIREHP